ncbi:MAG: (2Fe-2S)-binding protein [Emcibacter sp.]|nr:(2Fe-2S)-binding protein [Emcibacter sp.]
MFKRNTEGVKITFTIDGTPSSCQEGETVAAAILATNPDYTRKTTVKGDVRAPFCMMGACFECIMEIDGVPNRQACLILVKEGMKIRRNKLVIGSDWA